MTTAASTIQPAATGLSFGRFTFRVTACHVATYFIAGILAYTLLDYQTFLQTGVLGQFMRPLSSKWVAAGPALQVIRGVVFAAVLYPFRRVFLGEKLGWLKLWLLIIGLAIVSTCGPSPGSLEGVVYTRVSLADHLHGLPEVLLQTLGFSWLAVAWNREPKLWIALVVTLIAVLAIALSVLGLVAPRPETFSGN